MPSQRVHVFTTRFQSELYEELQALTKLRRTSINQFVVTAVQNHLRATRHDLLRQYTKTVERLKGYAENDPDFEQAIAVFADAEAAVEDPLEGKVVDPRQSALSPAEQSLEDILDGA